MELVRFANQKGATSIRADDLDSNFARLQPISNDGPARTYAINFTPNGWTLTLYPEILREALPQLPTNAGSDIYLLASVNNGYVWVNLEDILPSEPPASGDYVLTAQNGEQVWVSTQDFFNNYLSKLTAEDFNSLLGSIYGETFALRTVERCDGKQMKLLGTDWYTP
jgi:hypothetical protein